MKRAESGLPLQDETIRALCAVLGLEAANFPRTSDQTRGADNGRQAKAGTGHGWALRDHVTGGTVTCGVLCAFLLIYAAAGETILPRIGCLPRPSLHGVSPLLLNYRAMEAVTTAYQAFLLLGGTQPGSWIETAVSAPGEGGGPGPRFVEAVLRMLLVALACLPNPCTGLCLAQEILVRAMEAMHPQGPLSWFAVPCLTLLGIGGVAVSLAASRRDFAAPPAILAAPLAAALSANAATSGGEAQAVVGCLIGIAVASMALSVPRFSLSKAFRPCDAGRRAA